MAHPGVTGDLLRRPGPAAPLEGVPPAVVEDARLGAVLDPVASLRVLYDQASFSEGTVWDAPRGRLVWSDVVGRRVLGWHPDGCVRVLVDNTHFINGNAVDRDGHLVHCEHGRRCLSRSAANGETEPFLTHYEGRRFNSPNDVTLAPDGALWFSDPTFGLHLPKQGSLREAELGHNSVYRVDPATGEARRMADFEQPNGLEFSPDGGILYVSDTSRALHGERHEIVAFDVGPEGALSNRRLFRVVDPGIPDGFAVDGRGWIWTTSKDSIQVFDAAGVPLGRVPTGGVCANCAFAPGSRRLFVAAEHRLLALDLRN